MISISAPAILSRRNGNEMPAKFEPPPAQPMTTSGALLAERRQLLLGLEADHGLVHEHVVEHGAERIGGLGIGRGAFDRLGDREPQRSERVGLALERCPAGVRLGRRAGVDGRPERLHHHAPVRLLAVGDAHHEDLALEPVELRRIGECRAPLTGAGLRRDTLAAVLRAVERLRYGGVGLVRAGRAAALVLVVDAHALEPERLLEAIGPHERRRAPDPVGLAHLLGDLVLSLARDLLEDDRHREQRREILGPDGLVRAGMKRWRRQRQVRAEVVPVGGQRVLGEDDLVKAHAGESRPRGRQMRTWTDRVGHRR